MTKYSYAKDLSHILRQNGRKYKDPLDELINERYLYFDPVCLLNIMTFCMKCYDASGTFISRRHVSPNPGTAKIVFLFL